jgi:hypothetical protein
MIISSLNRTNKVPSEAKCAQFKGGALINAKHTKEQIYLGIDVKLMFWARLEGGSRIIILRRPITQSKNIGLTSIAAPHLWNACLDKEIVKAHHDP